jgi:hypothetical protein
MNEHNPVEDLVEAAFADFIEPAFQPVEIYASWIRSSLQFSGGEASSSAD